MIRFVLFACGALLVPAAANAEIMATAQLNLQGTAATNVKAGAASIAMAGPSVNVNNGALEIM